jgi:ATP-binding cassette subfamily B protein
MPSTSSTLSTKRREKQVTRAIHRLFWDAMFQSKGYAALTVLMHIPAFLMQNVFVPLGVAYALQAIITRHFDQLQGYTLLVFALSVGYVITMGIGSAAFGRNGVIGAAYVQRQVFSNYLHKDYDFYSNAFFGSLGAQAARVRDAFIDYNFVMLYEIPKQVSVVLVAIGVIAYKSPLLALITLICMLVALGYTIVSSRFRLKYRRIVGEASSDLAAVVGDALSHAPTVKSFANETYEEKHLEKPLHHWFTAQIKSWDLFIPANGGRSFLVALTTCTLLLVAGHLYQQHVISIAMVALVQLYAIKLLNATEEIATIIKQYEATFGASYQPVQTMLLPATITDKAYTKRLPPANKLDIRFEHVRFSYPDGAKDASAVDDFDLTIKHGEKVGLIGYSGSGKTTVTKLLLRFMDVADGAIRLGDTDVRELAQKDLRKAIAYVPQEPLLFHRSIVDNILYAKPNASTKAMKHAAKLAYVDEFVEAWPNAYDTLVGERGVKLSGGQRQRVAIARALLKDAPILVLDEATSALDSRSEQLIQKALWELMKDRTALVIAHRLSTIQRMDKIVVMDKGRVVQCGTHAELLEQKQGIYARLWAHQSGGYLADPEAVVENR